MNLYISPMPIHEYIQNIFLTCIPQSRLWPMQTMGICKGPQPAL